MELDFKKARIRLYVLITFRIKIKSIQMQFVQLQMFASIT